MKPKLLIVDDDEEIRTQMKWALCKRLCGFPFVSFVTFCRIFPSHETRIAYWGCA